MRHKKRHRRRTPPGAAPGTLIADPNSPRPVVRVMAYSNGQVFEQQIEDFQVLHDIMAAHSVTWINVDGLGDVELISRLADTLSLHRLAIEDTVNTHQRAKVEHYANHLFVVMHMPSNGAGIETEQVSLYLGKNYVITFQEGRPGDPFDPVRERIRKGGSHLRQAGADFLAYCLIDAVIDAYFPLLENLGEHLENLEDEVLACHTSQLSHIHRSRRELMVLRRAMWPFREALNSLLRDPSDFINDETRVYLRDCYDHTIRILDFIETYRELAGDLMDLYLSSLNQRMTEVMKVLTIMSTIFIPLTFISSIYGMNFQTDRSRWNMPELTWRLGYPFALLIMACMAIGMLFFFRRKGWIGPGSHPPTAPSPPDTCDRNVDEHH